MAVGGSHRGVINGNNNRGKPYGLMLLLAFGAALLGVMVIHKLRERRIFNLLVKEKDQELKSLHFLLQKEKEYTKELKSNNEEMKTKIYSLRTQKMELDRRILEMQSTIDSLKDEHKTMESALEEKQNEIKVLRDANFDAEKGTTQMITLTESLKQKEAEIEDLKHRLKQPLKIWSVSTDDPSNPTANTDTNDNKINDGQRKEVVEHLQKSNGYNDGANSTTGNKPEMTFTMLRNGDNNTEAAKVQEDRMGIIDRIEESRELELQKTKKSVENLKHDGTSGKETIDNVEESRKENSQDKSPLGTGEERNSSIVILNSMMEVSKAGDAHGDLKSEVDQLEQKVNIDGQVGDERSQQEIQNNPETFRGRLKLEVMENNRSTGSKEKKKHVQVSEATGKRWRTLSRNRLLENSGYFGSNSFVTMKNRKFSAHNQHGPDREVPMASNSPLQATRVVDSSTTQLPKPQNPEDMISNHAKNTNQLRVVQGASERLKIYPNSEVLRNKILDREANKTGSNAEKQSSSEVQQHEDQEAGDIQEYINSSSDMSTIKSNAEKKTPVSNNRRPEESDAADRENVTDETAGDSYMEADLEEDDKYKEETDESEF